MYQGRGCAPFKSCPRCLWGQGSQKIDSLIFASEKCLFVSVCDGIPFLFQSISSVIHFLLVGCFVFIALLLYIRFISGPLIAFMQTQKEEVNDAMITTS